MTARYTIKRTFRDNYCLLRLTELQIYIISLTGSDIARANTFEDEVDAEPAISYLGINLANLQEIMLAVLVEGGSKSRFYPVDVMLIHLRLHLKIAEVVDDAYLLSGRNALSQLHIEQTDFARNGAADVQFLLALANQLHILLHGFQIITHLLHLRTVELCILLQSLADERMLLDGKVCNTILELDDKTIYTYRGNYAYYLEKRQERMDNLRAEIQHSKNLYRRELDWMRRQPQARGHKAKYREDAFYELEKVAKQRIEDRQVRLKASTVYIGSKIFECQYVSKAFDDRGKKKVILDNFYYNFARFEKMGIVGNNGTGKSTFIKMLLGEVQPDSGKFDIGETVRFGYFSQEGLKFREDQKVIDVITEIADYIDLGNGKHMTASQFLQFFLFTPEEQHNYVYKLSGGEKRKLYLCTVLMRNPNFLVLDEPTNDLDIQTLQVLEEYLQDFAGCVIVVSHDRYFMDKVVDHLLVFKGEGEIQDFPGNYTQYREWSRLQEKDEAEKAAAAAKSIANNSASTNDGAGTAKRDANFENKRKMSYKEKREYEQLTQEIDKLTEEQKMLEEALCSGTLSVEELTEKSKRLPEIKDELDEKEMRWLELAEML